MDNLKRLVVFDLDGTLNRTDLYAVPAHKKALAEYGIFNVSDEQIIDTFGSRAEDSIPLMIGTTDKAEIAQYLRKSASYEDELIKDYAGEYEGVTDMLNSLQQSGYQTAVCSNASERYIRMVLDALQLTDKIDYIQPLLPDHTKDTTLALLLKRAAPDKALMVGDRIYDKNAAKANSLPFIGCLYGFCEDEVADADIAVSMPCEIHKAVDTLIG